MNLLVKDKNFYLTLLAFALPISLQQLINIGVNMADNIMIGQLGEVMMSGVTLANSFISIYQIMCMGLGMGCTVLISRFYGKKDQDNLKKAINIMFRLQFVFASLFALVTLIAPGSIMSIFSDEEAVINAGIGYLLISVPCYYLNGYATTTSLALRSVGKGNIPLLSSICSFFINIFCNYVFIFGKFGAPVMGVNGAALGTLIARIVEFMVTMGYLFFKDDYLKIRLKDLTMKVSDLVSDYFHIAFPVFVSDSLMGFGNSAIAVVMGHIGANFVAANSITTVVMNLATAVIVGLAQSSCAITGITLGKGEKEKAKAQGVTLGTLGFLVGCVGCVLILLIKKTMISFYKISDETVDLAGQLMDALAITVLFQCTSHVLAKGVLRGGGDTKFLMIADMIFLWIFSLPLGALSGLVWHLPGFWTYLFLRIDHIIKTFVCVYRLNSDKWIKKI